MLGILFLDHRFPQLNEYLPSLLLGSFVIFHNRWEGLKAHALDPFFHPFPFPSRWLTSPAFLVILWGLLLLSLAGFFHLPHTNKSALVLTVITIFLYNHHTLQGKNHPPLDLLCHLSGACFFTLVLLPWEKANFFFAIGVSLIFTGGYMNHLLKDKDKDRWMGYHTLAHRLFPKFIRFLTLLCFTAGFFLLAKLQGFSFFTWACLGFLWIFGWVFPSPSRFRLSYHLIILLVFLHWFLKVPFWH